MGAAGWSWLEYLLLVGKLTSEFSFENNNFVYFSMRQLNLKDFETTNHLNLKKTVNGYVLETTSVQNSVSF